MSSAHDLKSPDSATRVVVRAIVSALAVLFVPQAAWLYLLHRLLVRPAGWEVPAMAAVLVLGAAYLKWGAWPRYGFAFRREGARLNPVPVHIVLAALVAGWGTMIAGFCLYAAHRTGAGMGGESPIALPHVSGGLLIASLVMAGVVAGSIEEVAFRGFLQGTLEKRFGLVPAILVSGLIWAGFHTNHSYFGEEPFVWICIFLSVATMLGTIAHRTNSVLPGIVVHAGFDTAYFVAAGLLQPRVAPIAFVQSLAGPAALLLISAAAAVIAAIAWIVFFRSTRQRSPA